MSTATPDAPSLAARNRSALYDRINTLADRLMRGDLTPAGVLETIRELQTVGHTLSYDLASTLAPIVIGETSIESLQADRVFMAGFHEWFAFALSPIDTNILSKEEDEWTQLFAETLDGPWKVRALTEEDEGYEEGEEQFILFNDEDDSEDDDVSDWGTEQDKEDEAQERNREDDRNKARYGFPFAWNTGWIVSDSFWRLHSEDIAAAGFLAYEYQDVNIIGVDGAGYSFEAPHFIPLYLACHKGDNVQTSAGHRRVVGKGD